MKRIAILALLLVSAAVAQAETKSYLAPEGIWVLCDLGVSIPGCGVPGSPRGVYALHFHSDSPLAVGFKYTLEVQLEDGSSVTRAGIAPRADNSAGWTSETMVFGKRVVNSQIRDVHAVVLE